MLSGCFLGMRQRAAQLQIHLLLSPHRALRGRHGRFKMPSPILWERKLPDNQPCGLEPEGAVTLRPGRLLTVISAPQPSEGIGVSTSHCAGASRQDPAWLPCASVSLSRAGQSRSSSTSVVSGAQPPVGGSRLPSCSKFRDQGVNAPFWVQSVLVTRAPLVFVFL